MFLPALAIALKSDSPVWASIVMRTLYHGGESVDLEGEDGGENESIAVLLCRDAMGHFRECSVYASNRQSAAAR